MASRRWCVKRRPLDCVRVTLGRVGLGHAAAWACVVVSMIGFDWAAAAAQGIQWKPAGVSTPDPEGFITVVSPATCSDGTNAVPAGGYVRLSTQLRLDFHATVTGVCEYWFGGVHYPQGDHVRGINAIKTWYTRPGLSAEYAPLFAPCCSLQDYDTRNPPSGGNGSLFKTTTEIGTHDVSFRTSAFSTNCYIPTESAVVARSFSTLRCEPKFKTDSNNNVVHLSPTTITLALPSSLSGASTALQYAIDKWNGRLGGTGVALRAGSCTSGPSCIPIAVDPQIDTCGAVTGADTDTSGAITGGAQIMLHQEWATFDATVLRRTFIHEIGHYLGLDNYLDDSVCTTTTAAMNDKYDCPGPSTMDDVTIDDYLPVTKTVYGAAPRTTCGF